MAEDVVLVEGEAVAPTRDWRRCACERRLRHARASNKSSYHMPRLASRPNRIGPRGCLINRERDRAQECDIRVESGLVCWTTIGTLASITAEYGVSQEQVPVPLDPLKRRCFVRRAGRPIR
jgi:hypothetical protein